MEKFKELVSLSKCSVEISVNAHRDFYESVEQYLTDQDREGIDQQVYDEMIKRNTIVRIHAYTHTPVGCFVIYHYDIDIAIDTILTWVKRK